MNFTVKDWDFKETVPQGEARRFLVTKYDTNRFSNDCFIMLINPNGTIICNGFHPPQIPAEVMAEILNQLLIKC